VNDERDEIRARVDIVDLIGSSVRLERKGKSYKGLCPFHADKKPSFDVSPDTGRYNCWSCGEKGDIFTWVMKTQNVEFPEALRTLAKIAGVTLSERSRGADPSQKEAFEGAMAEAQAFFREQLENSVAAKAYCARRGLPDDVLQAWGIGYAPEGGDALTARLKRKGFALADCKTLFLVDQNASGGFYDKFRGRLMFPIWNEKGELVAFGGRIIGPGEPKYINSSDTPLYRKSRVLYGMNRARADLQKSRKAVLVEGYLDVIACHRAGVTSALASLGTALSEDQGRLLKRWVEEVVILYDSDAAGQKAADRGSKILAAEGLKVRVALMPDGEDPDTLLATLGPEAVQQAVEKGLMPVDYRIQALERVLDKQGTDFWTQIVPILAEAPSEMELDRHIVRLAHQYPGVTDVIQAQKSLRKDVAKFKATQTSLAGQAAGREPVNQGQKPKPVSIGKRLLSPEIVVFRAFIDEAFRADGWLFASRPELFSSALAVQLSRELRVTFGENPPSGPPSQWIHRIESEELQAVVEQLLVDPRGDLISNEMIKDAVLKLRAEMEQRKINHEINQETSAADRLQILKRLKEMKPDKHQKPPSDSLF
jgi:DNA primase